MIIRIAITIGIPITLPALAIPIIRPVFCLPLLESSRKNYVATYNTGTQVRCQDQRN